MFKFVVMEHHAKKAGLHYDLRFQKPDDPKNWLSFAIRKGVPLQMGTKVLAIRTNIHSEEEAMFLGTIDDGYGAGVLKLWDKGECDIIKYSEYHMVINFKGRKVKGIYHFVTITKINKMRNKGHRRSYLFFKGKEEK